tara:strand:- start:43 stop:348 length:306 start_codon:yes stop_codon:yes gene_type:complete
MNIKCLKCETVFELPELQSSIQTVRLKCSVCHHEWDYSLQKTNLENNEKVKSFIGLKKLMFLNLIIIFLTILTLVLLREKFEFINDYWQNIYLFFDNLIPI